MRPAILLAAVVTCIALAELGSEADQKHKEDCKSFEQADSGEWREIFCNSCAGDWKSRWFLDGEVASVTPSEKEMQLSTIEGY